MEKKILVTGATGFIGNHVMNKLVNTGYQVIATSTSEEKARRLSWFPQVTFIPFNLAGWSPSDNLYDFFQQPDILIHLAWEGLPNYKAAFHIEENLPRHFAFLTNLVDNGLRDLTITGTCFEYGMKEGSLREDMVTAPSNAYAIAKDSLRIRLEQYQQQRSFNLKWVRLFYMYGAGQNPNSLLSQLEKALRENQTTFNMSGGEQVRDFLPVEEVAANIIRIALQNNVTGVINCSSGQPVTVKQFVEDYLRKKNKHIKLNLGFYPYADYEPMAFWGDNSKLKKIK